MKKNTSLITALFVAGIFLGRFAKAQESLNVSGSNATGSGGTVAYSVGQIAYTTITGSSGSVAQGVQHAYEIFNVGTQKTALNISLNVFPNPTADNLTLHIGDYQKEKLLYQIFDMQGEKIHNGPIVARHTQISMIQLPPGTYFLNVVDQKNQKIHSFKIIKIQKI